MTRSPGGGGGRDTGLLGQDAGGSLEREQGELSLQPREQGGRAAACLCAPCAGLSRAPSLSAQPGSLVLPGDNLTLQCHSEAGSGSFALTKDEGLSPPLRLEGQQSPDFPLGRVSRAHGGRYRCYSGHNLSYAWSAPSAPLDILIAGEAPLSWPRSRLSAQGAGPGSALVVTGSGRGSWSRGPGGAGVGVGNVKTGVRGAGIKETHTGGPRGAGRAHREAPCSGSGVWGGALYSSPPFSPQECTGNPPSLPTWGPQCPRERT